MILNPVSSVRYFEFPFAASYLRSSDVVCLDVSSPRLFSLYAANRSPQRTIRMINPDEQDLDRSARLAKQLGLHNLTFAKCGVDALSSEDAHYDCIWSISVVEHITGEYDDRQAVRWMYQRLKPSGRLILTVPVDREFQDEYREQNHYGTSSQVEDRYFFQRWYDRSAIWSRIVDAIGAEPRAVRWFGEIQQGHFAAYEARWTRQGLWATVDDERDIADNFCGYGNFEDMPGQGVCGLMFEKPRQDGPS